MSSEALISIKNVSFSYPSHPVFSDLSLELAANQIVGIIGKNGTGKSTLLKLLLGLIRPHSGSISLLGYHPGANKLKEHLGSALQDVDFPQLLRVREILHFVQSHYSSPYSVQQLIDNFSLSEFSNKRCGELSGGMCRRLALACAITGKPKILLLDEPTTGLDLDSREKLMQTLSDYCKEYKALVLMISHHPQEITQYVNNFLLLNQNAYATLVDPERLRSLAAMKQVSFSCASTLKFPAAEEILHHGDQYSVLVENSDELVRRLVEQSSAFESLNIGPIPMDQVLEKLK